MKTTTTTYPDGTTETEMSDGDPINVDDKGKPLTIEDDDVFYLDSLVFTDDDEVVLTEDNGFEVIGSRLSKNKLVLLLKFDRLTTIPVAITATNGKSGDDLANLKDTDDSTMDAMAMVGMGTTPPVVTPPVVTPPVVTPPVVTPPVVTPPVVTPPVVTPPVVTPPVVTPPVVTPPVVVVPVVSVTAAYDADTETTTISSGSIAANGFASIGSENLPDLEEFFTIGGTIGVDNGDTTDDKNARSVVISEILWGLDDGETDIAKQNKHQFIELYNTTSAAIDVTGWKLIFTEGRPVPDSDIDQVSNRAGAGWDVNIGQSGRVTNTTADGNGTSAPINIVSMYRKINYGKVEKVKADGTADPNRDEQKKGIPGGNGPGSWAASKRASANGIFSSIGRKHFATTAILTASAVARSPFIINEIGNGDGDTNDWVEIRNVDSAEKSLENYHLSYVSGFDKDTSLVNFKGKGIKVPGNGVILLVNTDPKNTNIAAGRNAAIAEADQELTGATSLYYIDSNLKLPDDGKFNLILRNAHDKLKASSNLMDVVGGLVVPDDTKGTSLWPLVATGGPHGDVVEANGRDLKEGYVYIRKNAGGGTGEHHLGRAGYTGVGYDRAAVKYLLPTVEHPATRTVLSKSKIAELSAASITFSEIMVDVG